MPAKNKSTNITKHTGLMVIGVYAILVCLFFFKFFSVTKLAEGTDWLLQGRYFAYSVQEAFDKNQMPYWLPYIEGGMPNIASMNTTFFYPTFLLANILRITPDFIFQYDFVLHIFLAGLFCYLWLRRMGTSWFAAACGGSVYMLSGNLITLAKNGNHIYDSMAFIPLVFFFLEMALQKREYRPYLYAGAVMALQNYSNGWQFMTYTLVMATAFVAVRILTDQSDSTRKAQAVSAAYGLIAMTATMAALSAISLLPSWQYSRESIRATADYEFFTSWSVHPSEFLTYLIPSFFGLANETYWGHAPFIQTSFYIGILPLVLGVLATFNLKRQRLVLPLVIVALLALLMSTGKYTPLYRALFYLPVIKGFRDPGRWLIFFTFACAGLSALGLDILAQRAKEHSIVRVLTSRVGIAAIVALLSWLALWIVKPQLTGWLSANGLVNAKMGAAPDFDIRIETMTNMIVFGTLRLSLVLAAVCAFIYASLWAFKNKAQAAPFIILGTFLVILSVDVLWTEQQFISTIDPGKTDAMVDRSVNAIRAKHSEARIIPVDSYLGQENWPIKAQLASVMGYHGLPLLRYDQARNIIANPEKLLRLYNAKYVLSMQKIDGVDFLKYTTTIEPGVQIYEFSSPSGAAYIVRATESATDFADALNIIQGTDIDIRKTAIIEQPLKQPLGSSPVTDKDSAKVITKSINSLTVSSSAIEPSLLVVSENYYPAWKASVNNKAAEIIPVNGVLRGIIVPAGNSTVTMKYDPILFYVGGAISGLAWIGLALIGLERFRRRRRPAIIKT